MANIRKKGVHRRIAREQLRSGSTTLSRSEPRVLSEKQDVGRHVPGVVEPTLIADRVEPRALGVPRRRVVAERGLVGLAACGRKGPLKPPPDPDAEETEEGRDY